MVVQKSKLVQSHFCNKCGGLMRQVMMPFKSESIKFVKINQCKICRFWHEIQMSFLNNGKELRIIFSLKTGFIFRGIIIRISPSYHIVFQNYPLLFYSNKVIIMTAELSYSLENTYFCEKCGSIMLFRRIISSKNRRKSFMEIYQCDVCRFWHYA